jgi:protein TonB
VECISRNKGRSNWLLHSLLGVSLAIHLVIFSHIAGIYRSGMLSYIELTLKDISKPPSRNIPRPRLRSKTVVQPQDIKSLNVSESVFPSLKPINIHPLKSGLPESLVEPISPADIPDVPRLNISAWNPESQGAIDGQGITASSYLEMVRLKIESHKRYPKIARVRQIEGRVTIYFIISPAGDVQSVKVVKSSAFKILDQAALKAVEDASPFPIPPAHVFGGEIPLKISLVFELT